MDLDTNSKAILRALQSDATLSANDLAQRLTMSSTTVWRRIQDMEQAGVFSARAAVLNPEKLGLEVCVLIEVNIKSQDAESRQSFEQFAQADERITQCFSLTGQHDYVIVAYARSIKDFEAFLMNSLLAHPSVESSNASLVLNRVKNSTALPI